MGIFGRIKKVETRVSRDATAQDIRHLSAFASLKDSQLAQVAAASSIEAMATGPVDMSNRETLVFLHRGAVSLEAEGRPRFLLAHDQPGSSFSLPANPKFTINALSAGSVLKVPARFLVFAATKPHTDYSTEWRNASTEDHPCLAIYEDLKNGKCELPSMPDIAARIGKVIDDPTTASDDIARVIQTDLALAARVMSVVNSAAYRTGQEIQSLSQAVSRLGRQHIRNLVFSFIVKGMFQTDSSLLKKRMSQLWEHSCHVGAIAAVLARHTPGLDSERALLAGLVHDIGVVPILDRARALPKLLEQPEMLDQLIEQLRGEIGAQTMRQWGFDQEFIDIAARAEDWMRAGDAVPDYLDVVLLAQLHAFIGTPRMQGLPLLDQVPAYRKVVGGKLTPRGSLAIIDSASREIEELRRLLSSA